MFSEPAELPYYAVILSVRLNSAHAAFEIMMDKMMRVAAQQKGFLGVEKAEDEINIHISYWQDLEAIKTWQENTLNTRAFNLGENFWFEAYQTRIVQVLEQRQFEAHQNDLVSTRFPTIKTARGVLKMLAPEQAPLLHDYVCQNRSFFSHWEPSRHESYYELETCLQRIKQNRKDFLQHQGFAFFFLNPEETKILGNCNFSNLVQGVFQACYLGYSLAESEQKKGLMHEALSAGIEYMHKEQNISRIMANYMPHNHASGAVLKRLGFAEEGKAQAYLKIAGKWEDHILNALVMRPKVS
jgi:ribosomal-protein-alanine N-acetyltransferase